MMALTKYILALLAVFILSSAPVSALEIGGQSDCDSNAIFSCGVHSTLELKKAYRDSDYIQKVYAAFGISAADIHDTGTTAVSGTVNKHGSVFIDGQSTRVAGDAITAGRQDMPGSTPVKTGGITFYKRPPRVSFQSDSLPAYVVMKNGQFQFAIIASCANPVIATPVLKPAPKAVAAPQPTPPVPTQTQQQTTVVNNNVTQTVQTAAPTPATEQPSKLINTGPGSAFGTVIIASIASYIGYRRYLLKRIRNA